LDDGIHPLLIILSEEPVAAHEEPFDEAVTLHS